MRTLCAGLPPPRVPVPAAKEALDASQEDRQIERLGEVVVRPRLQSLNHVLGQVPGRQHQHRGEVSGPAHALDDLEAVETREHDVEEDEIEALGRRLRSAGRLLEFRCKAGRSREAVSDRLDGVSLELEVEADALSEVLLVFDHQDVSQGRPSRPLLRLRFLPLPPLRLAALASASSRSPGKVMVNVEPWSGPGLSAVIAPL